MVNFVSNAVKSISALFQGLQVRRVLSLCLVGIILLTTGVGAEQRSKAITDRVDSLVHRDDSDRPKTTGEWQQEAREVEGSPGERVGRVAKESAEAVQDFGELYPDVVERSVPPLRDNAPTNR